MPLFSVSSAPTEGDYLPDIVTGAVIVPGTELERLHLIAQDNCWLEDGARRSNGFVEFEVPLLGTQPIIIELDSAGPYVVDVSMGGSPYTQLYSSGQMDGDRSGRMRRQIKVDQGPAHPMKIRIKRRDSASDPFTLWRVTVLRIHEIFPGSNVETEMLVNAGESTLLDGGGRLIPADTSISYRLNSAGESPVVMLLESSNEMTADIKGYKVELQSSEQGYWGTIGSIPEKTLLTLTAIEETKIRSLLFSYGLSPIDAVRDVGSLMTGAMSSEIGISLSEEPVSIVVPEDHQYFWCFTTSPETIEIYEENHSIIQGALIAKLETNPSVLNITGEGELLSFAFDSDEEGDGIPGALELILGTDPFLIRSDNDDIDDYMDAMPLDTDNDGLNDEVESFLNMPVNYSDCNIDGIPDGVGLDGYQLPSVCAKVKDRPWIGARYQDVYDYSLIRECSKYGMTSAIIDFHEILISRKPEDKLLSQLESAGECDGFLLDGCAISDEDFDQYDSLIDEYQLWAGRIWTDIDTDTKLAFTLHNFTHDRVDKLLELTFDYAEQYGQEVAVSIPSPCDFTSWLVPYNSFEKVDRLIIEPPSLIGDMQLHTAGLFDALFVGRPLFVEINDEAKSRAYISGVRDAGKYMGVSIPSDQRPMVITGSISETVSNLAQIVNESSVWSKRLDSINIHQNWQTTLAGIDCYILPSRVKDLDQYSIALLDIGTTFISAGELEEIQRWITHGGNLFLYTSDSRFSDLVWWKSTSSLGEIIADNLGIKRFISDTVMKAGKGTLYVTTTDPVFSIEKFKNDAKIDIDSVPPSYQQLKSSMVEVNYACLSMKMAEEYPKTEYPIHIEPAYGNAPYVMASTCAVPWIKEWGDNIKILAQAPRGTFSSFALVIDGKPTSVTSSVPVKWNYSGGVLFVSFSASGGGDGFVVSTEEGLDLSAVNLGIQPLSPEANTTSTVTATVYNASEIPSGEYSLTFYWDEKSITNRFKTMSMKSIPPGGYEYISFQAPVYLETGEHQLHIVIHTEEELNLSNNNRQIKFRVVDPSSYRMISMQIGHNVAFVDGEAYTLDSPPVIRNGRTMVPFRFLAESLGAEVSWNDYDRMVTFTKDDTVMYLWIGNKSAIINSQMIQLDSEPIIINGRTMVPLRVISENLGAKVSWDGMTRTVSIRMKISSDE